MRSWPLYVVVEGCQAQQEFLQATLKELFDWLYGEPWAIENAWVSIATCGGELKTALPLTHLAEWERLPFTVAQGSSCCLAPIRTFIRKQIPSDLMRNEAQAKVPWHRPLVLVFVSEMPRDARDVVLAGEQGANVAAVTSGDISGSEALTRSFRWIIAPEILSRYGISELFTKYMATFVWDDGPLEDDFWRPAPD